MAQLTPLSLGEARELGERFGLRVMGLDPLLAGSVNTSFAVHLEGGERAFLRIYEEQTAETARHEADLLGALAAAGVPTPCPLPRVDGPGAIAEHLGKPVAIFPYLSGEVVCQRRVSPAHARAVGTALARVHQAGAAILGGPLGPTIGGGRFGPAELAARLEAVARGPVPEGVGSALPELLAQVERWRDGRSPGGEVTLIHGDLFRDNVLFEGDRLVALLDFESASRGSVAFDLAVTLLAWCFGDALELPLARALAEGYLAVRPLTGPTRGALDAEALRACTRFSITRITDFELRPRGTGVYKDFRRWIARADAVRALGPGGLEAALFG